MKQAVANIIKKIESLAFRANHSESYAELVELLDQAQKTESTVKILFPDLSYIYHSRISAVNSKHKVVLTKPADTAPPFRLTPGRLAVMRFDINSREIQMQTSFIDYLAPDLNLGIEFFIPNSFFVNCPREAARLVVDGISNSIKIRMNGAESALLTGVVKNISRLGLGIEVESCIQDINNQVVDCKMTFKNEFELECEMEIRRVRAHTGSQYYGARAFIGGKIVSMAASDKEMFTRFLAGLKRNHLPVYA